MNQHNPLFVLVKDRVPATNLETLSSSSISSKSVLSSAIGLVYSKLETAVNLGLLVESNLMK